MRRSTRITSLAVVLGATLALGVAAASAQTLDPTDESAEPYIVLTGHLTVEAGTTVEDAIIFDGDATIDGNVSGNAVALNGDVVVNGDVSGDVIALNGRVTVAATGSVTGNVMSRLEPALDGEVGGDVQRNGLRTGRGNRWTRERVVSLRSWHEIPCHSSERCQQVGWLKLNEAAALLRSRPCCSACCGSGSSRVEAKRSPTPPGPRWAARSGSGSCCSWASRSSG